MEASPRYLGGGSFLARRDPRVLILVPIAFVVAAAQVRDWRVMLVLVAIAFWYYAAARIPWRAVRANWTFVLVFVFIMAGVNGIIAGAKSAGEVDTSATLFTIPLINVDVTGGSLSFAFNLFLRFLAIAATGFPLAFSIRPGDLAVAFARLGVPARFAYGIDLTFKFLPTTAASLRETIAAQRLRGYEPPPTRNPIRRILQLRPLIIPVAMNSFIEAEDVVDALDLRGFGTQKRTWLRQLAFGPLDILIIVFFALLAVAASAASLTGWMPPLWTP
ncbi:MULTISPECIES: energy-coupling factor transporter transmembrane component T family protein [unclassified Plantibacter]|uniref:energy-coupling factor transporter transmembrane component T family protein n=1 Tax=unclassified Plantibacter TaxID=2624265 RepID=UPI003D345053